MTGFQKKIKIKTKNPPIWRVLCWAFGYSLKAVRGRTLQTPKYRIAKMWYKSSKKSPDYNSALSRTIVIGGIDENVAYLVEEGYHIGMKKILISGVVMMVGLLSFGAMAEASTVRVKGYVKPSTGRYVAPHYKTSPNRTKADNYSTKGNYNPYSGKKGTVKAYKY